jgi:acyl carrier protein phosphodiesterase
VEVGHGIRLHRAIDDVSDRHEASREARAMLRATCGKWSGVVWDVLVDHVLAAEFEGLATGCGELNVFAMGQEAVLAAQREAMPERSRRFFDAMVAHGWLAGYREPETVEAVLVAMSRRRETAGPVARGWKAFLKDEESLREMGRTLVRGMETWGKAQNLVSLAEQHR